jgi:hypothetical protein
LAFSATAHCFAQNGNTKKRAPTIYANWISVEYLNCLKTELPCECEKWGEPFLIDLDTTKRFALLYNGQTNYDYYGYNFNIISPDYFELYDEQDSPASLNDTVKVIGSIKINSDTLLLKEHSCRPIKFSLYATGDNHGYVNEHIELVNSALAARGYNNLNKLLHADSLKCFCNWEFGGINLVWGDRGHWILEKKENQLLIYQWTNPPAEKTVDLKIKKKLLKKFKW